MLEQSSCVTARCACGIIVICNNFQFIQCRKPSVYPFPAMYIDQQALDSSISICFKVFLILGLRLLMMISMLLGSLVRADDDENL